jgi:hypothetical protein
LPVAEKSCPGIGRFYDNLAEKPATFLQLLWAFEGERVTSPKLKSAATARRRRS